MGAAAVFNPCGVALLPASLAWIGGTVAPAERIGLRVLRAVGAGLAMAAGFTAVVAILAVGFRSVGALLDHALRPVMLGVGAGLVVAGGLLAMGRWHFPLERWIRVPAMSPTPSGSWLSWLVAGGVYAVGSLSCTLPLFVAALAPLLAAGWWTTMSAVTTIGAGVASLLVLLSVGTVWLRDALALGLGRLARRMPLVLGSVVGAAGLYLVYYWAWGPGHWLG